MCDPTSLAVASLAFTVLGTVSSMQASANEGKAQRQAADYKSAVARNNAIIAQRQSVDAQRRGLLASNKQGLEAAQLKGRQKVGLAAAQVDVFSGTAQQVLDDTSEIGRMDQLTAWNNAIRESQGFDIQASNFNSESQFLTTQGYNAEQAGRARATTAGISGLGQVASKWYGYSKPGGPFAPSAAPSGGYDFHEF